MPTYDYKCNACAHRFEQFQSMKDKPLRKCPACGKAALERLIGIGAAVIFKGSGFYQTDYRSEAYKKSAESDKPAEAKSEGKSEAKSDAKSDGKPGNDAKPAADSKLSDSTPGPPDNPASPKTESKPAPSPPPKPKSPRKK